MGYIDNKEFKKMLRYPRKNHHQLCLCFNNIAWGISSRFQWRNAGDQHDAVSFATIHCIEHVHIFDVNRGTSPLAYFTTMAKFAICAWLRKEKKIKSREFEQQLAAKIKGE